MKKNDLILIAATAAFSYLFYKQDAGINFLVFSVLLILLLVIRNREVLKSKSWLAAAAGVLISGVCVALYANGLSVFAGIVSLGALSAFSFRPNTSIIVSLFHSFYSVVSSFVQMILDSIERSSRKPAAETARRGNAWMLYVLPLFVVFLFFILYKDANPLFDNLTQNINFNFISLGWLLFTTFGFFLLYGFFYHKTIPFFSRMDEGFPNTLSNAPVTGRRLWNLDPDTEYRSGLFLLLLLNTLLLLVNLLDAKFIFIDGTLPVGLTYSAYVHQGTGTLILSIIMAILLILFYFRGELNFYPKKQLKLLAALWLLQNIFMVFSTAFRNHLYIEVYSLTYKRIGVYVWLLLALIGLITTLVKIYGNKSNWFLFRSNGWLFYSVLVLSCCFNWDVMIADYNINRAVEKHRSLDKIYLLGLSDHVLPELIRLGDAVKNGHDVENDYMRGTGSWSDDEQRFRELLNEAAVNFYFRMQLRGWRSWSYCDARVYNELLQLEAEGKIDLHHYQRVQHPHNF